MIYKKCSSLDHLILHFQLNFNFYALSKIYPQLRFPLDSVYNCMTFQINNLMINHKFTSYLLVPIILVFRIHFTNIKVFLFFF
jgi:hypothetical protein